MPKYKSTCQKCGKPFELDKNPMTMTAKPGEAFTLDELMNVCPDCLGKQSKNKKFTMDDLKKMGDLGFFDSKFIND